MSPAGIFAVLMLALAIDGWSVFPEAIRCRIAFCLSLAAIREGWDGSTVDRYTVDLLSGWIDQVKQSGNEHLAAANTVALLGVLIDAVAVFAVGCLVPPKWAAKIGDYAKLSFNKAKGGAGPVGPPGSGGGVKFRLSTRLWVCAYLLGLMAELPKGLLGSLVLGAVTGVVNVVSPLPNYLFGVS